jgi:hypothetical protein
VDPEDNELIILEQIHLFVEVLDRYFGNVRSPDMHAYLNYDWWLIHLHVDA